MARNFIIKIRFSKQELEEIRTRANSLGDSLASYIRKCALIQQRIIIRPLTDPS